MAVLNQKYFTNLCACLITDRGNKTSNTHGHSRSYSGGSSDTSSISTKGLQRIIDKLRCEKHRVSTRKNYYSIWKTFNEFYVRLDDKPCNWEDRLVLFVGHLVMKNRKSTTIASYISAIKSVLLEDGIEINEDKYLLSSLTKACKLRNDTIRLRLPIQKPFLRILVKNLETIFSKQPYLECMYKALFATAYFGLFRVGELTESQHVLLAKDVHIADNKDKLMFILHTSKTHWFNNKPQIIKISRENLAKGNEYNKAVCPYYLLRRFLKIRKKCKNNTEQFFIFSDRSPVKPNNFRCTLRESISQAGIDSKIYDCHSFRAGRAGDLVSMGISLETVKKLGRWRSNSVYTYLR